MPIPTIDEQTRLTISNKSFSIYTPFTDPEALDPYFFDPGYTLAAQTAHSIWEGANIFLNFLTHQPNLQSLLQKYKSIELGTGTGVCGIGIGVIGGSCLLTDINSTLSTARTNVLLNFKKESWDGNSGCAVQALDWSDLDLDMSGLRNVKDARIIIAVETAWLKCLARDFCRTFSALIHSISKQHTNEKENMDIEFEGIQCSKFGIWVYKERGTAVSEQFTTLNEMIDLFMENECTLRLIERVESLEDKGKWLSVYMVHPELR